MAAPSAAAHAPPAAFAAWRSALASYRLVFTHPGQLVRIAWLWVAIAHLVGYAGSYLAVHTGEYALAALGAIAVTLCAAAFAVKWHRRALLGMDAVGPVLALGRRDAAFIGRALLLVLATFAPLSGLMLIAVLAMFGDEPAMIIITLGVCFVLFLAALHVLARLSLVLPATAVDEPFGWRAAWAATAGASTRLWGGALVVVLPLAIASKLIENLAIFLVYNFGMLPLALAFGVLSTVFVFLTVAVAATYTSLAYRALAGAPRR